MGQSPWAQSGEVERPTHTSVLTRHMDENPRRRDEEVDSPRSPKSERSSGNVEQVSCTRRQNTEEDGRDVQAKKNGNIQIKQPSPPHSIQCIKLASRINGGMTLEQYRHSLQHIFPPPANLERTSIQRKISDCTSGGLGCNLAVYIKKGNPSRKGDEKFKRDIFLVLHYPIIET